MTNPQKTVAQLIKKKIGDRPTVQTQKLSKSECVEFDGSVEQLYECISKLNLANILDFTSLIWSMGLMGLSSSQVKLTKNTKLVSHLKRQRLPCGRLPKKKL